MYLSKFQLLNYKSFLDSQNLEFKPGINIIVGTNNSGKTALLEALSLQFTNNIHKSPTTFPSPSDVINSYSGYQLSLVVKKDSILPFIKNLSQLNENFLITLPDEYNEGFYLSNSLNDFFNNENIQDIEIQIIAYASAGAIPFDSTPNFFSSSYNQSIEDLLKKKPDEHHRDYYGFSHLDSKSSSNYLGPFPQTIQYKLFQKYRNMIYKFNAERLNLSSSPVGTSCVLESDASNLAEVILNIQSNRDLFKRFNKYVSTVIPSIKWVSASLRDRGTIQIKIWTFDPVMEREDLAYSLSDCGTGVSQVLAILYVIITSQEPQIIIIDEPQSFLHPGAAKKIIEIFKEFPQHQYFISTHSAEIIAAANPSTIVKLGYEDGETKTSIMNAEDIIEQSCLLAELGVSLSDVFGADNILWVEGITEEMCFPLILSKLAPELLRGTKIIAIKNTDDLVGGKTQFAEVMFDLYGRLSGGKYLSPPVLGFVFDRENRDEEKRKDLKKRTSEKVHFLKKCMYENYLLHPNAIAAILTKLNPQPEHAVTSEAVRDKLEINKAKLEDELKKKLEKKKNSSPKNTILEKKSDAQDVEADIDAAKLLKTLFTELSFPPVKFEKNPHSIMLTDWLLKNEPDHFVELVDFLRPILEAGTATAF
jgi:predicted ATPase